jgi:hypothetical protein
MGPPGAANAPRAATAGGPLMHDGGSKVAGYELRGMSSGGESALRRGNGLTEEGRGAAAGAGVEFGSESIFLSSDRKRTGSASADSAEPRAHESSFDGPT